jgi:hypothetical protein
VGIAMEISQCFCPNKECEDYAKKGQGNIVCYDIYGKHKTKLLRCRTCKTRFSERRNTVFFGLHLEEAECQLDELWSFVKKRRKTSHP